MKQALLGDLEAQPRFATEESRIEVPRRPLRIFVSCAEASGEIHALNLVEALRTRLRAVGAPTPEFVGLGGSRLANAGVALLGDPVSSAKMGFSGVLGALPFYLRLVHTAAQAFAREEIDLFIPVDSPALHVPLGHIARRCGVPVVHYVTPQYWAWAPWRVGGYRGAVDLALSILPFEPSWFERHGVEVAHVGHPLLDALPPAPRSTRNLALPVERVALLPGSRRGVIELNLPVMLRALDLVFEDLDPPPEVWILQSDEGQRSLIEALIATTFTRFTPVCRFGEIDPPLAEVDLAFSVSGTVLIHLLHQRLPAIVLYRLGHRREVWLGQHFLTTPFFASVNLLAGREVYPEFSFAGSDPPPELLEALGRALKDPTWCGHCVRELEIAAERLGPPGAARRAADAALARLSRESSPA